MRSGTSVGRLFVLALLVAGCSANGPTTQTNQTIPSVVEVSEIQAQAISRLTAESPTASTWKYSVHPQTGALTHLAGRSAPLMTRGVNAKDATVGFLTRYRDLYKIVNPARELNVMREETDEHSNTHIRLQQVVGDIPVRGGEMIAHYDQAGALTSLDAHYAPGLAAIQLNPAVLPDQAHAAATADLTTEFATLDVPALVTQTAPALRIFAPDDQPARLAYHLRIRGDAKEGPVLMDYMIDAQTGVVLQKYNDIETVSATALGVLGDTKTLEVTQSGATFQLLDSSRSPAVIRTNTARGAETTPGTLVTSNTSTSFDATGPGKGSAVDAHFYTGIVYDYYKKTHARLGIDGNNAPMVSTVHYGQAYNNAFWDGTQMAYGDGDGTEFRGFSASLDVVGHELTHGVTERTSNLEYLRQSGALNEAVSDIFGAFVEHGVRPDPVKNWVVGEDLAVAAGSSFRDMIHPSKGRQPSNMSQFVNTTTDNGGVHTNSGIVNNAMYLMTIGGTNDSSKINVPFGLGWDKSAKLWYQANTKYFMTTTNFAAAAAGTLSAAKDLQFSQNDQNIVECGWIATGVLPGTCKPIINETPAVPDAGPARGGADGGAAPGDPSGPSTTGTPGEEGAPAAEEKASTTPGPSKKNSAKPKFTDTADSSGCSAAPTSSGDGASLLLLLAGVAVVLRRKRQRA